MPEPKLAKLFMTGRSQAVRLPKEFRFDGDAVRIRKVTGGVLLEPIITDIQEFFRQIDEIEGEFLPEGISQPIAPPEDFVF